MVRELFEGGVYFNLLKPDNRCGNNSRAGGIQGNTVCMFMFVITYVGKTRMSIKNHSTGDSYEIFSQKGEIQSCRSKHAPPGRLQPLRLFLVASDIMYLVEKLTLGHAKLISCSTDIGWARVGSVGR